MQLRSGDEVHIIFNAPRWLFFSWMGAPSLVYRIYNIPLCRGVFQCGVNGMVWYGTPKGSVTYANRFSANIIQWLPLDIFIVNFLIQ